MSRVGLVADGVPVRRWHGRSQSKGHLASAGLAWRCRSRSALHGAACTLSRTDCGVPTGGATRSCARCSHCMLQRCRSPPETAIARSYAMSVLSAFEMPAWASCSSPARHDSGRMPSRCSRTYAWGTAHSVSPTPAGGEWGRMDAEDLVEQGTGAARSRQGRAAASDPSSPAGGGSGAP